MNAKTTNTNIELADDKGRRVPFTLCHAERLLGLKNTLWRIADTDKWSYDNGKIVKVAKKKDNTEEQ